MNWPDTLRHLRRRLKDALPFVRRRRYERLQRAHDALIEALDGPATPASSARIQVLKEVPARPRGEFCLFVAFAAHGRLKPHVAHHIRRLIDAGISVALVANSTAETALVPQNLREALSGCWIRENTGYDFSAWAHALSAMDLSDCDRLYLVNDSIVGPLDLAAFNAMLARVRASTASIIGLTDHLAPRWHLQSYFLVLSAAALHNQRLSAWFARMRNWPDKSQVIAICESRMTRIAVEAGLSCEALFPSLDRSVHAVDETSARWAELVERGLPYLKGRVIASHGDDARIQTWMQRAGIDREPI